MQKRAKLVGRYFREEFGKLKNEIEKPAYFREKLIYNYLYKGPVLEWYMRIKTRLEKIMKYFMPWSRSRVRYWILAVVMGYVLYVGFYIAPKEILQGSTMMKKK